MLHAIRARNGGQAETRASQIVDLADETLAEANPVAKARPQVGATKRVACKLLPRKSGDRVVNKVTGSDGGPIRIEQSLGALSDLSDEELAFLEGIVRRSSRSA